MAQLGPNDIEAKFVLTDEMTTKVKDIEKNLKTSTEKMSDSAKKTTKTFDGWNFALNAAKVSVKLLSAAMRENKEVADTASAAQEGFFSALRMGAGEVIDFLGGGNVTADLAKRLGFIGLQDQIIQANEELARLRDNFSKKNLEGAFPAKEFGEAYAMGARKKAQDLIDAAEQRLELLNQAEKFADPDGAFGVNAKRAMEWATELKKGGDEANKTVAAWAAYRNNMTDIVDLEESRVELEKQITEELQKQREQMAEFDFGTGFQNAANDMEAEFTHMGNVGKRFAQETRATISNDLFSALKREEISFADFTTHIFDGILKQITDMISAQAIGGIASLFGGGGGFSLSGLFGGSSGVGASSIGSTYGDYGDFGGGELGANITGAGSLPSFGGGGVADGPSTGYLAILHGRERVTPENGAHADGGVIVNLHLSAMDGKGAAEYLKTPAAQREIGSAVMHAMKNRADVRGAVYDG